ncbi:MAG: hypothetical protein EA427_10820 [Spirochaetaceae bacterium]|nr:MAG: hypothetical protein EA427_10820 [Spirochaetaceae bacterium]
MKTLVVYYSITGRNEQLAKGVRDAFTRRGHTAEIHGLKTVVPLSALTGVLMSVLRRPSKLAALPPVEDAEILVIVGPVWASSLCPAVRAFLNALDNLEGKSIVNLVVGYGIYEQLMRKINHTLKVRKADKVVSRALRLKDMDSHDKIDDLANEVAEEVLP